MIDSPIIKVRRKDFFIYKEKLIYHCQPGLKINRVNLVWVTNHFVNSFLLFYILLDFQLLSVCIHLTSSSGVEANSESCSSNLFNNLSCNQKRNKKDGQKTWP